MNILKKSLVLILSLSFLFGDASLVVAGSKKTTKKKSSGSKRAAGTKAGKKSGSKRSGSSKSSKKSVRSASSRRRAAAVSKNTSGSATTSSGTTTTTTSTASTKAEICRNAYSECMDIQIKGILSKYSYLGEDSAVEAISETGDPLRCVYYYSADTSTSDVTENKNINNLYYAYNYYCSPKQSTGSSGQPVNICNWDTSNKSFASKKSYAYYNEAFKRLKNDELTILNFTQTKLYQNKIKDYMGQETASVYQISSSDVSDMLTSLGLDTSENTSDQTLFSVNVAPPTDAGSLNPQGVFQKAHEICMGNGTTPTTKSSGLGEEDLNDLKGHIKTLSGSSCQVLADDFIDYYQAGTWKGCKSGYKYSSADEMCVKKTDTSDMIDLELVDTGFLSAKNSCASYEQALIANRERIYAKFQDQLTNYLNDNLAQLIKKEAKGQSTIAKAFNTLYKTDAENKLSKVQTESEIETTKLQTEADLQKIKAETAVMKSQADVALANAENEAAKARADAIKTKNETIKSLVEANKAKFLKQCDTSASELALDANFSKNLSNLKICMKDDGSVVAFGSGCGSSTELLCVDDIGFNANTFTESKVASISW
ncbi:MAG: hypothetical protein IJ638_01970, partial [Alphaproteobacteria bacterium]|nr:hypothetical protein [Alphaproteobacteria bacterium]